MRVGSTICEETDDVLLPKRFSDPGGSTPGGKIGRRPRPGRLVPHHRVTAADSLAETGQGERPFLSVIMPVFNECQTFALILERVLATPECKEVIIVDDGSDDGTREAIAEAIRGKDGQVRLLIHHENEGKGAAVRTALEHVRGDYVVIQDADLEYDPAEYSKLVAPIASGQAEVVYGSRFMNASSRHVPVLNRIANHLFSLTTSILFRTRVTDMLTCYKVFPSRAIPALNLRSSRWGFDPEITAKLLKQGYRFHEIPVQYTPRSRAQGKKITWRDGFSVMFSLVRYRIFD